MAQKIRLEPGDYKWNDDFLKEHVGEKVALRTKTNGELYENVLRCEGNELMVGRWTVGQSGSPEDFFDYLEIYPKEDSPKTAREAILREENKKTRVIHCPTGAEFTKVLRAFDRMDKAWSTGNKPLEGISYWDVYKEDSCLLLEQRIAYGSIKSYEESEYYEIISASDWLAELMGADLPYKLVVDETDLNTARELFEDKQPEMESFYGKGLSDSFMALSEYDELKKTQPGLNNLSIKEKTMGIIKSAFKSKEVRALEHFGLTNGGKDLNDEGLEEFLAFLWETADKDTKNAFYKLVVDRYNEAKKRD